MDKNKTKPKPDVLLSDGNRFRLLVEAVVDYAIYMLTVDGIVASWNKGAEHFKGYTEHDIVGQHYSRFFTDEDREAGVPQRALETAAREGRYETEGWRVRKDGTRLWVHAIIDPICDPSGKLLGFAKITRDVTARRAAEEDLRRSEERFRLLVQSVRDYAIYMIDPLGHVTNWNLGAQRFKGYAEHEIVGQHFSRFYTEEDRATGLPARALETAAREGRFEQEGWRVRKDGTRFWASVVIDPIRDAEGRLLGFAKITRDISERRAAQIALEETRAKLLQLQKMEAIGQISGGIAHDFNNLLAVVLGNLELARKRLPDDARLVQLVDNSIAAARRGASLTQRMLAFARRQDLKTEPVDVPALVRNMADLLQRSIGPLVHIQTQFPLRLAHALADANQLELALLNLVVNARDAMPEGGMITIASREESLAIGNTQALGPGRYVALCVADTGSGMDPATLARAAEPFFTTKGVGKGTGLGLSMVHGFAEQSGGRLFLASTAGAGTSAEIWLPAAEAAAAAEPEPAKAGPQLDRLPAAMNVLVVDDDPLVLMNTVAMLEDLGHSVLEATSAEQSLRILHRAPPVDLVVVDHFMPGMLGSELVARIRKERPELPVVLASGNAEMAIGDSFPADVPRLGKPFTQAELSSAMARAVEARAGERVVRLRQR